MGGDASLATNTPLSIGDLLQVLGICDPIRNCVATVVIAA
jgi:hypothetical protein